ncbi:MAG: N-formylglutamate amidohydrolase [Proteobacteria bacterium]|nr:N-formylglutamate amidohydrolase [Pseudomonadota bacterium]MDA1355824.1 N-formylglutamate amidohydrolase [Pseudomonadota bacterium]
MNDSPPFDPARLNANDPPPFTRFNPVGGSRFLLTCDHASRAVPGHMNGLGLTEGDLSRHIAWDIGAAAVTRHLAERLDATAFLAGYSRLVIDCNRPLTSPTSIPPVSDGSEIPANQGVSAVEAAARADALFWPYHRQVAGALDRLIAGGKIPLFVAVHSFTPQMSGGEARPWQIGLLWEHDGRLVAPLQAAFSALVPGICIGDNEPYAIVGPSDYSIPEYGQKLGLPHIEIEIRQDLIDTAEGAALWAGQVAEALETALADHGPFEILAR